MRTLTALFIGICFFLVGPHSQAWNKATHMVSAAIAYADLKERNPAVLTKALEVLKKHPQFFVWAPDLEKVSSEEDKNLYLFMLAARWSDDVRGEFNPYDRPSWHYVDIPYRPEEGQEAPGPIPVGCNLTVALVLNRAGVQCQCTDDKACAFALCWMLHLIGDVHQPLHTISLFTKQFPDGDRGGTIFHIRETPGGNLTNLHHLWDELIIKSDEFQKVRDEATTLRNKPGFKREDFAKRLDARSFDDWAREAWKIAVEKAYRKGTLPGSTKESDGPDLPSDYMGSVKADAEKQVVLSGYRISDAMIEVFGK